MRAPSRPLLSPVLRLAYRIASALPVLRQISESLRVCSLCLATDRTSVWVSTTHLDPWNKEGFPTHPRIPHQTEHWFYNMRVLFSSVLRVLFRPVLRVLFRPRLSCGCFLCHHCHIGASWPALRLLCAESRRDRAGDALEMRLLCGLAGQRSGTR